MTRTFTIGFSPCPNDTYIFYGLISGNVSVPGLAFREWLEDVETLNQLALREELDFSKISYHALGLLRDRYALLRSGGALGRGCGPLLVARQGSTLESVRKGRIAVPGELTTANLLLRLYDPEIEHRIQMPFDRILHTVASGTVDAGVIIHESRFTYRLYGLEQLLDLGAWWEGYSGHPIPLGGIIGRRALGPDILLAVEEAIRQSLSFARANEREVLAYCRRHSQEMDEAVMKKHIDLYVNDFSLDVGTEGAAAVHYLIAEAERKGIFRPSTHDVFIRS